MTALSKTSPIDQVRNLMQIAYVTTDMDRALKIFREDYGIEKVLDTGVIDSVPTIGAPATLRVAMAYVGSIMFEAIQPIKGGDMYREPLPDDGSFGFCFHHVCFGANNLEHFEAIRAELIANDHPIVQSGAFGDSAYLYADTRRDLGHYCEYAYLAPDFVAMIPCN